MTMGGRFQTSGPYDEVIRQIKLGKSRVSEIGSQNLRPIYDQREHVQKIYNKQTYKKGIFHWNVPSDSRQSEY